MLTWGGGSRRAGESMPWLVLEEGGIVLGYAYASVWKARAAYDRSREVTVYLHHDATGKGRGRRLIPPSC